MPKGTKASAPAQDVADDTADEQGRPYVITKAKIKDDFCYYSFSVTKGAGTGEEHKVTVDNVISDDMKYAFEQLFVHLAAIDDVFKHAVVKFNDIEKMHGHELTQLYHVTGFEIHGEEGDQSVVLIGTKFLSSTHDRMPFKTPKIAVDSLSSYQWYNELASAVEHAREEVALYKEGKYVPPADDEDEEADSRQLTIADQMAENNDNDLEAARV